MTRLQEEMLPPLQLKHRVQEPGKSVFPNFREIEKNCFEKKVSEKKL